MAIMNEKQMSLEQMCARIKSMHTELEELEKALKEGVLDEGEQWTFPEDNYTVLAIWLLRLTADTLSVKYIHPHACVSL